MTQKAQHITLFTSLAKHVQHAKNTKFIINHRQPQSSMRLPPEDISIEQSAAIPDTVTQTHYRTAARHMYVTNN